MPKLCIISRSSEVLATGCGENSRTRAWWTLIIGTRKRKSCCPVASGTSWSSIKELEVLLMERRQPMLFLLRGTRVFGNTKCSCPPKPSFSVLGCLGARGDCRTSRPFSVSLSFEHVSTIASQVSQTGRSRLEGSEWWEKGWREPVLINKGGRVAQLWVRWRERDLALTLGALRACPLAVLQTNSCGSSWYLE